MTPERWRQIESLYHDARALTGPERAAFLATACGDDALLRDELLDLLEADARSGALLDAQLHPSPEPPSLVGRRLGVFEVVALIGTGGMGDVYRAHDTRLQRDVALKVPQLAPGSGDDRLVRFEREARALAALNHPHIGAIYGFEDAPASDGLREILRALVLELVEGPTLAERLKKGPLPLREALVTASQVAEALDAAHEKGVIHRDSKPANIKVTADEVVKVLDFGLARLAPPPDAEAGGPSRPAEATRDGIVMGTVAYMSPEQARGQAIDKRTDIWAFGCLLFEMLAGTPPFAGATAPDVLAAVVSREPDWTQLPPEVPPTIQRLLRRCLEKAPRRRLRDIGDARIEIDDALSELATVRAEPQAARHLARGGLQGTLRPFAYGVLAAAVLAMAWMLLGRRALPVPLESAVRAALLLPPGTSVSLGRGSSVALSPDGRQIVYVGERQGSTQLYLRRLDELDTAAIAGTEGGTNPFFSPDGRWIAFFADSKLKKVTVDAAVSAAPVQLADAPAPRGEAWGPDDFIYFTPTNTSPVMRIPAAGGTPEPVTTLITGELSHRWPHVLPGGNAVLFTIWNAVGWEPARIAVQPLDGGEHRTIVEGGGYSRFLQDPLGGRSFLVYARAEGLVAAAFDPTDLALRGPATRVLGGLITNLSGGAHYSVSRTGTLAYLPGAILEGERDLRWVDRTGASTHAARVADMSRPFALSRDGRRVVRMNTAGPTRDVWIEDLERGSSTRVTFSGQVQLGAIWSSDDKEVVYGAGAPSPNLFRRPADGRDLEDRLTSSPHAQFPTSWNPDGKALAFSELHPDTNWDIWVLTGAEARPFVRTPFSEGVAQFSPDGQWVAYQSNESGRFEVYVRAFPDGGGKWQVSTNGGREPMWAPNGRELFYRFENAMMAVNVTSRTDFTTDKPRLLFSGRFDDGYAVSPDGERFLMMPLLPEEADPTHINVVSGWLNELRQVP